MTKTVTLIVDALDENRMQRKAGESFLCSDSYAEYLANANIATYPTSNLQEVRLSAGGSALVSGDGTWPMPFATGLRTVLIGDSYLDREMDVSTDLRTHNTSWGSVHWANVLMGSPLRLIKEAGIGGERVTDILSRVNLIPQYAPQVIFVSCGINDLKNTKNSGSSIVTGVTYPTDASQRQLPYVIGKYDQLIAALSATGAIVFLMGITSPANGASDQSKQLAHRAMLLNRWLQYRAGKTQGMYYLPVDRITYDPTNASGNVLANYYSDTIHPSITAAFKRGQLMAAQVKPVIQKYLVDRLPSNIVETYSNLNVPGTALTCDGTTMTVTVGNSSSGNQLLQVGDKVVLAVPSVGNTSWNGVYTLLTASSTAVTMACTVAGSYTGTINMSAATQMYDNPLFTTQTGGSNSGAGTLTSGAVPSKVSVTIPATSSVIITYSAHTDIDGVADGMGSWFELALTGSANADFYVFFQCHRSLASSSFTGRFMNGDTIKACADLQLVSPVGVYSCQFGLVLGYTNAAGTVVSSTLESLYRGTTNTDAHPNIAFRGAVETNEWKLPSGGSSDATSIDGQLRVTFGAAGGTATIKVGRVGIMRVDYADRDVTEAAAYQ